MKGFVTLWVGKLNSIWDQFVPTVLKEQPETNRRARLQIQFGFLGALFGMSYSLFYLFIGHTVGAMIIIACSMMILTIPKFLIVFKRLQLTGNLFAAILVTGFTGLCIIEGGMAGHALAWLATIPLFVFLLIEGKAAVGWAIVSVVIAGAFGVAHLLGIKFPVLYPKQFAGLVDFGGYTGLIPFVGILGYIFEKTRQEAQDRLVHAMNRLTVSNAKLSKLIDEKNSFLDIAAHDLKNPLSVISGYADLLCMDPNPSSQSVKKKSNEILTSANRMIEILKNLLSIRELEDEHFHFSPKKCPVEPILDQILEDFGLSAQSKGIRISVDLEERDIAFHSDTGATHQIIDNLISNAIKYSPFDTKIRITAKSGKNNTVVFSVCDEGPGLSEKDQDDLFKKFSRLSPKPTGGESSHGLGLWVVNMMAKAMNGCVVCDSTLGEGSTFSLILPSSENVETEAYRRPLPSTDELMLVR